LTPPRYPAKPHRGDRVAVLSPSSGLPEIFPAPFDLGLARVRDEFGLVPVEYPTTRRMDSTPADRAADIHAAFADPTISAILSSIGGDDQITVLPYLDRALIAAHPKPFFGYSDNTNLLTFLWNCGIVGFHGGSVMVQFGRPGAMHPATRASLEAALFTSGPFELHEPDAFAEMDRSWGEPATFESEPALEPCDPWTWQAADRVVEGVAWGGNLEILSWLALADAEIGPPATYAGGVLIIETSEEMPSATEVGRVLRSFGERGLLRAFAGVLVGRPKAWSFDQPLDVEARRVFRRDQRAAIRDAFGTYGSEPVIVFDVDFGHTDPQLVLPIGGLIRIDGPARRIVVTY
jgi:muramoyltetrapeptide carboxypeptidase LdcA involved in peptidoglycan recycling